MVYQLPKNWPRVNFSKKKCELCVSTASLIILKKCIFTLFDMFLEVFFVCVYTGSI